MRGSSYTGSGTGTVTAGIGVGSNLDISLLPNPALTHHRIPNPNAWSVEQDSVLMRQFYELGYKWTQVASAVSGKSPTDVGKRFRNVLEPAMKKFWWDKYGNKKYALSKLSWSAVLCCISVVGC